MPRDDTIPSPSKRGARGPQMAEDDPSIVGKLDQLAQREAGGGMGGGMGGGGSEQESAQLLMSGAQALMQAAQMNPRLQPIVQQAMQILQAGVQEMAGGAGGEMGGMAGEPTGKGRRRVKPPTQAGGGQADQFAY